MERRSQKRIMRRRRSRGGIVVSVVLVLLVFSAIYAITSSMFMGGKQTAPQTADIVNAGKGAAADNVPVGLHEQKPSVQTGKFKGVLAAQSAVLLDGSGNLLYALEADAKRYPASTTKVLTALIALENGSLTDIIRVGEEANLPKPGSSTAGLRYGEKLSLSDLLNAMMIPSGNDAAYVIATYIGRKVRSNPQMDPEKAVSFFVGLMNSRARQLGAVHSQFTSPDGFHDEQHYTTARDMSLIAREAMNHKEFRQIVVKTQFKLPDIKVKDKNGNQNTQHRILKNTNELLDSSSPCYLQNCIGIKTGHTNEAGYCLVSSVAEGGKSVLAVVLDSTEGSVWQDSSALLQWGLLQQ